MRILLFASAYNSMTQRFHVELVDRGHDVSIELALGDDLMRDAVSLFQPDIIVAPFLKSAIPEDIWQEHLCIIIHPGIKGDRGAASLDWAILNDESEWGVTALQAAAEMDAGDIWSSINFPLEGETKSDLYRGKVAQAAIVAIHQTLENFTNPDYQPESLDYSQPDVKGIWRDPLKQADRSCNWATDSTATILRKIRSADSQPALLDTLFGEAFYLCSAHAESTLKGKPGEIIAQRHGAICRATIDGAVWIECLKPKKQGDRTFFKLPAAMVLGDRLRDVPEVLVGLEPIPGEQTWREIWYEERNQVGYLHFPFYNGAMSTEQCLRLRDAYVAIRARDTKVIVLMGGTGFWSNGIHLNVVEAAIDPAAESWLNINGINDFIYAVLTTDSQLVIAAMQGNAAAGGVMMALAADRVNAREGIVLNPHYKRMGLYGSEYWTYTLPRRVGAAKAEELTNVCMPLGTHGAKSIGLIDDAFGQTPAEFRDRVVEQAEQLAQDPDFDHLLELKQQRRLLDEQYKPLAAYRQAELAQMQLDFISDAYHQVRRNFVYKACPSATPPHLAVHRQPQGETVACALLPLVAD
jgi:putative two-component system protein, hydrogenase maturation factor HypX/HoxX